MAYFPNASDGGRLYAQCEDCPLNKDPDLNGCEVLMLHELFNYDQLGDGQEKLREAMTMLVADDGICQIRLRAKGES